LHQVGISDYFKLESIKILAPAAIPAINNGLLFILLEYNEVLGNSMVLASHID